ncbi:unnamed protein product [Adineta ricciae]|uniref:Helix-turn-helix domain-containing protein n=1 Tax=Adineta ricciae TaxID=249248 RepID=A0A815LPB5_ADIRI|nr:unnamed protein product [Adineta ricciae]
MVNIIIDWPQRHLLRQIDRWNKFDKNIILKTNTSNQINIPDLQIIDQDGNLITSVYHKPSYGPYYLLFYSIHPLHMKQNIPFTMLLTLEQFGIIQHFKIIQMNVVN